MIQNKRVFWTRFILYIVFCLVLPMAFLIWKFNLFSPTTKLNIGGWGMVVIIFTAVFLNILIKEAVQCIDSSVAKRVLTSIRKVLIPLLTVTLCLYAVDKFINELIQFFIVITVCEPIGYVLNPMPEYLENKKTSEDEEKQKNTFIELAEVIWSKKNK